MKSISLETAICEEILADIFGTTNSEQTQLGLTDATDPCDFASKLTALEERWNCFEVSGKRVALSQNDSHEPEFYNWFVSEKSSIVRNHMIQSVRKEALLGNPPEKFYTNASECQ